MEDNQGVIELASKKCKPLSPLLLVLLVGLLFPTFANTPSAKAETSSWNYTNGPGNNGALDLLYVASRNELYRAVHDGVWLYDPISSSWIDLGASNLGRVECLAFDGRFLYAGCFTQGLWRYDTSTGSWSEIQEPYYYIAYSLEWDGSFLYVGT